MLINENAIKDLAGMYHDKYRDQVDLLEKSVLAKVKGGIDAMDVYSLGKQLQAFETYRKICEEEGNVNQLGAIPKVAFDVITAVQGVSILPHIASVQPIEEERGNVYFKNIRAATTKGNLTAGQVLVDPRQDVVTAINYSENGVTAEQGVQGNGSALTLSFVLAAKPIRSETLKIYVQDSPTVYGEDVGPASAATSGIGRILGQGVWGTVNYVTGQVSLTFGVAVATGKWVYADYQQNYELADDLPQIDTFFDSKGVMARVFALKGTIGMLQSYGMKQRFGIMADDEMSRDLVTEINREIAGKAIRLLRANAVGLTQWDMTPPSHISYGEHKNTYMDYLLRAESTMSSNAGRGTVTHLVVGKDHAAVIGGLPGFKKMYDGQSLGAHVYGQLDNIVVIRVLESSILGPKEGVALWKGSSPFEAPVVYCPFMPLVVTGTIPQVPNPLNNMKAAAVWAGIDSLVGQFATKFDVIETSP